MDEQNPELSNLPEQKRRSRKIEYNMFVDSFAYKEIYYKYVKEDEEKFKNCMYNCNRKILKSNNFKTIKYKSLCAS
ncbi:hypothetical protein P3S67_007008 [Capsicum chacoense]